MEAAVKTVKEGGMSCRKEGGMSCRKGSRVYNVPFETLRRRVVGEVKFFVDLGLRLFLPLKKKSLLRTT